MQLVINNLTGSTRTYLSGAVSVAGSGSTTVSSVGFLLSLSTDGGLHSDIVLNNASIGDGTNTFGSQDAINYLNLIPGNLNASFQNINTQGQNAAQSITTTAAEAKGGASRLANREFISLTPTNGIIYWGFSSGVTTSSGIPIFKNQTVVISATDAVPIYVISSGTVDCRIAEGC